MMEILSARKVLDVINTGTKRVGRWIAWTTPSKNVVKLNTDGAFYSSNGKARAGGLIRDFCGKWLGGFVVNIGHCTVTKAELWAVYHGLLLAWDKGFKNLEV